MRLHRLQLSAFGPFRDEQVVDFDELSEAGLFLLTGDTGAGKSAVLDAVAYALYGRVPGEKETDFRIRNTRTAPTTPTRVELEFTVREQRLRVSRVPEWQRPKKRGTGTTTERGSVLLERFTRGAWQPVSARVDEVGHELSGLLGMTHDQFCQVVLLPQGRFSTFLDAKPDERRTILERLFGAERFTAIERWLTDAAHARRSELEAARTVLAGTLGALAPLTEPDVPAEDSDLGRTATDGSGINDIGADTPDSRLRAWALDVLATLERRAVDAEQRRVRASDAVTTSLATLTAARALTQRQREREDFEAQRRQLDIDAAATAAARAEIAMAEQAAPVLGRLTAVDDAADLATATEAAEAAALQQLSQVLGAAVAADTFDPAESERCARAAHDDLARLAGLERDETQCADVGRELVATRARLEETSRTFADLARLTAGWPGAHDELVMQLTSLRALAVRRDHRDEIARTLSVRLAAAKRRDTLERRSHTAAAALAEATAAAQDAREAWLDRYEARVAGMAAELASGLVAGDPCPVCGSPSHPQAAPRAETRVSEAAERAARATSERATERREAAHAEHAKVANALAVATVQAGGPEDASDIETAMQTALAAATEARGAADSVATTEGLLADLEAADARDRDRLAELDVVRAQLRTRCDALEAEREHLATRLADQLCGAATVAERRADLTSIAAAYDEAAAKSQAHRVAQQHLETATRAADLTAKRRGFAGGAAAAVAVRSDDELAHLRSQVRSFDDQRAVVGAALDRDDLVDLPTAPPPVAALTSAHEAAQEERASIEREIGWLHRATRRARSQVDKLLLELDAMTPLREAYAGADALARLAAGTGQDNRLRMRLSSYVLSARLEQVAAAASERLLRMTDGRYALSHTDERGRSAQRSGLGLSVHDAWDATDKPPAALSGGERFLASLSLALGLSDVVTAEAGGTPMETLFVDEGFGSLDGDTLDAVLDVLDGLRSGGRAVGIVSHLAELRSRIPAQLAVTKARTGSTLARTA